MAAVAVAESSYSVSAEVADGPVMSMMGKRLRALKKKYNRILQMEESLAQGKPLNKEQEEVLRTKPALTVLIEEYEKLRQPLSSALSEERDLARQSSAASADSLPPPPVPASSPPPKKDQEQEVHQQEAVAPEKRPELPHDPDASVEDLLNLLYFGSLFDVKQQSEFAATIFTRTHERGCCLTYDYVTDDATDLLHETDLDLISTLGSLVISRPVHSSVSHKNALLGCVHHAKLWLHNSGQPIQPGSPITYAWLRERLNRILSSDYFITTPEMKATVDVAAAVGKYAACQVQASESTSLQPSVQAEAPPAHHQETEDDAESFDIKETDYNEVNHVDYHQNMVMEDESDALNPSGDSPVQQEHHAPQVDEEQSQTDVELKEQQYPPRRAYQNQRGGGRGGGGGRRGYPNGRGGRGGRGGGGGYQNGRGQYYDSGYYPRSYYNTRGRGGRAGGPALYNSHGGPAHGGHASADVDLGAST